MKKTTLFVLSAMTLNAHADVFTSLLESQPTKKAAVSETSPSSPQQVATPKTKSTVTGKSCQDLNIKDQKSLPLIVVNKLIQEDPRQLSLSHDPKTGILKISSPDMIGNCNSMIEWKVNQVAIEGENTYVVEARLKQGADCKDGKCSYNVYKVENKFNITPMTKSYAPTMQGFGECIRDAAVFKEDGNTPDASKIYYAPINERITDIKETGKVLFSSEGPVSGQMGPAAGKTFKLISDCKYYEDIGSEQLLLSEAEENQRILRAEAEKLKECTVDDYHKVADFLQNYEQFSTQLGDVRDRLIKEAAIKSAKAILEGKGTEDDMRVAADFEKYIVDPKKEEAIRLFAELEGLKGTEKAAKQAELKKALLELAALGNKPYFEDAQINKLLSEGKFEQAEKLHDIRLTIAEHVKLGSPTKNGKVHTPELIAKNVAEQRDEYSDHLDKVREKYEITTGQVTGTAKAYLELANRHRRFITVRTQNFTEAMQDEYKRTIPGGYCYAFFRNTPKCVAKSQERIAELQYILKKNNDVDTKRAAEYDKKAAEYAELEKQGRAYVASQTGAEAPAENSDPDNLKPTATDDSIYTFETGTAQPGQPAAGVPSYMPQQPAGYPQVMPYQQNMYNQGNPYMAQQPFMAQSGGYAQFGGQANFGMQPYMGMQQPMFGQPYGQPQYNWGQPGMNYQMPYQMPYQQPMY